MIGRKIYVYIFTPDKVHGNNLATCISVRLFDKTKNTGVMYSVVFICTQTMNT